MLQIWPTWCHCCVLCRTSSAKGKENKKGFSRCVIQVKRKIFVCALKLDFWKTLGFCPNRLDLPISGTNVLFGKNMAKQFGQGPFLPPLPIFRAIPERKHFLWEVFPNSLTQAGNCLVLSHLLNRLQTMKVRRSTTSKVCACLINVLA